MSAPITQSIRLRWRPELRFYEQRIAILDEFKKQGLLEAFRVTERSVDAELPGYRWLSMWESGLTLNILTETDDTSEAWRIIEAVIARGIAPLRYTHARVSYQHLLELPFTFDDAQSRADEHLYRSLSTEQVTLRDWALLADITANGPPTSQGQIELGIVRREEVVVRLRQDVGRGPGLAHIGSREWQPDQFKEVSLFADSDLSYPAADGREEAFLEDAQAFWQASREQMCRLIDELGSRLMDKSGV